MINLSKTLSYMKSLGMAAALLAMSQWVSAAELTAFQLVKEGNKHVGEDARDKVVMIHSEKSLGTLVPNVWYIDYYDPDATFKATRVKFGAGRKLDVKRPMKMLEPVTGADKQLDSAKLKIDSDQAIKIATDDPILANLKLTATQLWLEHGDSGPQWKVRVWASKLRNPSRDTSIGEVFILAEDGKVLKRDWHISRVD